MFSLTNEMRVFRPKSPWMAVQHNSCRGPSFDNALAVGNPMNRENDGLSVVKGSDSDYAEYCVETDAQGNSVLTGDGGNNNDEYFICTGLEVFLIE